jgi:6-phosphogluconolactonase
MSHRYIYPDEHGTAAAAAKIILTLLEERLASESLASLAISGGKSPRQVFELMAKVRFDWANVHLFWVDERAVPPTDAQSNYLMAEQSLITPARISKRNVHRVHGELKPDEAARLYAEDIREFFGLAEGELPHFDVVHQGMGPDGHTASLFPGERLIEDRENIAAAVYAEKMQTWRVTLLPGVLLAARHTVMYVTGADKADAVHSVFNDPYEPAKFPAQIMAHHGRSVTWLMDRAAGARMD